MDFIESQERFPESEIGRKTDMIEKVIFNLLPESFTNHSKRVNGNPVVGTLDFYPAPESGKIAGGEWQVLAEEVASTVDELNTMHERITINAEYDEKEQKITINIKDA